MLGHAAQASVECLRGLFQENERQDGHEDVPERHVPHVFPEIGSSKDCGY